MRPFRRLIILYLIFNQIIKKYISRRLQLIRRLHRQITLLNFDGLFLENTIQIVIIDYCVIILLLRRINYLLVFDWFVKSIHIWRCFTKMTTFIDLLLIQTDLAKVCFQCIWSIRTFLFVQVVHQLHISLLCILIFFNYFVIILLIYIFIWIILLLFIFVLIIMFILLFHIYNLILIIIICLTILKPSTILLLLAIILECWYFLSHRIYSLGSCIRSLVKNCSSVRLLLMVFFDKINLDQFVDNLLMCFQIFN